MLTTWRRVGADVLIMWIVVAVLLLLVGWWLWELLCPVVMLRVDTNPSVGIVEVCLDEDHRRYVDQVMSGDASAGRMPVATFCCRLNVGAGVRVRLLSKSSATAWIRVLDGPLSGRRVWVLNKNLHESAARPLTPLEMLTHE